MSLIPFSRFDRPVWTDRFPKWVDRLAHYTCAYLVISVSCYWALLLGGRDSQGTFMAFTTVAASFYMAGLLWSWLKRRGKSLESDFLGV